MKRFMAVLADLTVHLGCSLCPNTVECMHWISDVTERAADQPGYELHFRFS